MNTKAYCVAGIVAALSGAGPAAAQSLSMSYDLASRSAPARETALPIARCAGFNWLTSLEACGRDLVARIVPSRGDASPSHYSAGSDLPDLGSPGPERSLRSSGGREALIGNAKAPDILLRLGSKVRMRTNEEGNWEWYKFTDVNYEQHVRNNPLKAVGVELLVPFQ